jgi:MFS transporter, putative metabolite:H+ symporter
MSNIALEDRYRIGARIERLPFSPWHLRIGIVIGTGWFFDGFDALAIAYALPALIPIWHLGPGEIGWLISAGYVGQLIGSIFFGWLSERIGRVRCILYTLILYSLMSLVCAFAWDYQSMLWMRAIQGLGLGGEIPILASYIGEIAKSTHRGRYGLGYQTWFTLGFLIAALTARWVVPSLGWQWLFIVGALPALMALPLRAMLPESPRWLASRGRFEEADRILARIEDQVSAHGARALPPIRDGVVPLRQAQARFGDLFHGIYRRRTIAVWVVWFSTYLITYGLSTWMPSILRTVYNVSLETSISYGLYASVLGLMFCFIGIFLVDRIGRRPTFAVSLLCSATMLIVLASHPDLAPLTVMICTAFAFCFTSILALGLSTYTAELYPTELRTLGTGMGNAWVRFASIVGPVFIGWMMPRGGLGIVYGALAVSALIGAATMAFAATETRGRVLEELSPSVRR